MVAEPIIDILASVLWNRYYIHIIVKVNLMLCYVINLNQISLAFNGMKQ